MPNDPKSIIESADVGFADPGALENVAAATTADNSLLASLEPQLRQKLQSIIATTIADADIG